MDAKEMRDGDFFEITGGVFKFIGESWEALKLNLTTFILLAFLPLILFFAALPFVVIPALTKSEAGTAVAIALAMFVIGALLIIAVMFLPAVVITQLASVRGKKLSFSEAFEAAKPYVLNFLGLMILMAITIMLGFILFIIPGLLAIFFLSFAPYILIDKKTGIIDAMKGSYELVKEYWKVVVGLVVVNLAIGIPNYVPVIGWIITLALSVAYFCLSAVVYVKIAGKATAAKEAKVVK